MQGLNFSSKLDWRSYIISIVKTVSKKTGALICAMKFLSPYTHMWNTVVMSGLVVPFATWNCEISYKNGYAGLLVPSLVASLEPLTDRQNVVSLSLFYRY